MDDDDDFLYGGATQSESKTEPQPIAFEKTTHPANGVVNHLEVAQENETAAVDEGEEMEEEEQEQEQEQEEAQIGGESEEEEEEEDIEFIMEPHARSLDFRQTPGGKPTANRTTSASVPAPSKGEGIDRPSIHADARYTAGPSLTTEYTPMQRGGAVGVTHAPSHVQPQTLPSSVPFTGQQPSETHQMPSQPPDIETRFDDDIVDPSTLPPVTAPPSHPTIDPTAVGILDGRSIFEVDLGAMAEKPWRRPGSDITDWFNYGFDEISWEAYCYRRRDLGEMANVLKTNVINFSAMPEDQLTALPPEVRQMVMTGTTAMMNGAAANPGMMAPGVMMDMSGMMGPMGMGMGMGGDMGMGGGMMQVDGRGMMPDSAQVQQGGVGVGNGTPEQVGANVGMMQDGYNGGAGQASMMNMGIGGGDFGIQDQGVINQQMYPAMEAPPAVPQGPSGGRGATPVPYRGRAQGMGRGRGFPARGRGRGGIYAGEGAPPVPVRPASPLPPGVPTGPRNQNKYKDRDGNAPAVDGLDYGGNNKDLGVRTPSGEPEDRISSRKRRSSPGLDEGRGIKRR